MHFAHFIVPKWQKKNEKEKRKEKTKQNKTIKTKQKTYEQISSLGFLSFLLNFKKSQKEFFIADMHLDFKCVQITLFRCKLIVIKEIYCILSCNKQKTNKQTIKNKTNIIFILVRYTSHKGNHDTYNLIEITQLYADLQWNIQ